MSAWLSLAIAIALEIVGTTLLKLSDGFEKPILGMASIAAYSVCFWFFAGAIKSIPVGVGYAIWAGVGILAMAAIGIFFFGQKLGPAQYAFIALILVGAVGLRLTTTAE
ncbi:MAG: QacE family quaternary ammonium compound efflux SMR transporter [Alphaproteobacteria bacterium]|nr:QacE family quaternary ammonium compound efflux SMR transporter [Alphaproteobacteria bacterium]